MNTRMLVRIHLKNISHFILNSFLSSIPFSLFPYFYLPLTKAIIYHLPLPTIILAIESIIFHSISLRPCRFTFTILRALGCLPLPSLQLSFAKFQMGKVDYWIVYDVWMKRPDWD